MCFCGTHLVIMVCHHQPRAHGLMRCITAAHLPDIESVDVCSMCLPLAMLVNGEAKYTIHHSCFCWAYWLNCDVVWQPCTKNVTHTNLIQQWAFKVCPCSRKFVKWQLMATHGNSLFQARCTHSRRMLPVRGEIPTDSQQDLGRPEGKEPECACFC
jgi:hypothetical protein